MEEITKPAFLVRETICRANIGKMAAKARRHNLHFRPHFKTHQSARIGEWFRDEGVTGITVSSVSMAEYFADHGWKDITIAFPCNILEINAINRLASEISLNLLAESAEVASFLAREIKYTAGIFLKIDTGYHRTGILPADTLRIRTILEILKSNPMLAFRGFLTHSGQTYHAKGIEEINEIHLKSMEQLGSLKSLFMGEYPELILSVGDTPSCSIAEDFSGMDEMRPGNFVFYDLMQLYIGSCTADDIAVAVICPVVATHERRREAVIYGGAVHFSKEFCLTPEGETTYGLALEWDSNLREYGKPLGYLSGLSQEHGILKLVQGIQLEPGKLIAVLPVHSCLTADLMKNNTIIC